MRAPQQGKGAQHDHDAQKTLRRRDRVEPVRADDQQPEQRQHRQLCLPDSEGRPGDDVGGRERGYRREAGEEQGDQVEVRGPFASYFVWRGEEPVLLVGGGSGVVPLMAILRHRGRTMPDLLMRLVYSVRNSDDVIYADELGVDALLTFTREPPEDRSGHRGRIDAGLISEAGIDGGIAFVCGSNGFVESASQLLLGAGYAPDRIRTERFGPTG